MDNCMCCNLQPFLNIVKILITVIQWSVPLLLIVLGTLDMIKAIAKAADEKAVREARSSLIKRLIYGTIIFLVPFLVRVIFKLVDNNIQSDDLTGPTSWISCFNASKEKACSGCSDIYKPSEDNSDNNNDNNSDNSNQVTCYHYSAYDTSCSNDVFSKYKDEFTNIHYDADGYCDATSLITEETVSYRNQDTYLNICSSLFSGFIKTYNIDNLGNMICSFKTNKLDKYSTTKPTDYIDNLESKICSSASYCSPSYYELCK